jgi:hypothetical protein
MGGHAYRNDLLPMSRSATRQQAALRASTVLVRLGHELC